MFEVSKSIVNKAHQPNVVLCLFDANGLTGKGNREIDSASPETDPRACCDDDGSVEQRIVENFEVRAFPDGRCIESNSQHNVAAWVWRCGVVAHLAQSS